MTAFISWIWFGLAVFFLIIEACTINLVSIWMALSALLMVFISRTKISLQWQFFIFCILSALFLYLTKVFFKKFFAKKGEIVNSLVGKEVSILSEVSSKKCGEAKTENGVVWNARLSKENAEESVINANEKAFIQKVEGNTLIISKIKQK